MQKENLQTTGLKAKIKDLKEKWKMKKNNKASKRAREKIRKLISAPAEPIGGIIINEETEIEKELRKRIEFLRRISRPIIKASDIIENRLIIESKQIIGFSDEFSDIDKELLEIVDKIYTKIYDIKKLLRQIKR